MISDICGPSPIATRMVEILIAFFDDFSRYGYIFLIPDKSNGLNIFKIYIIEVEHQLKKTTKIMG